MFENESAKNSVLQKGHYTTLLVIIIIFNIISACFISFFFYSFFHRNKNYQFVSIIKFFKEKAFNDNERRIFVVGRGFDGNSKKYGFHFYWLPLSNGCCYNNNSTLEELIIQYQKKANTLYTTLVSSSIKYRQICTNKHSYSTTLVVGGKSHTILYSNNTGEPLSFFTNIIQTDFFFLNTPFTTYRHSSIHTFTQIHTLIL